jgi:hypothetical protein
VVLPGAFTATLASYKAAGGLPGLYVEHSRFLGGDPLPIGRWTEMVEDDRGLLCRGKLSALDTDHGKRIRALMQDQVLTGLSIAFSVPQGGAIMGKSADEPRRQLKCVDLAAVDIVRDPSNKEARVRFIKSLMTQVDSSAAAEAIGNAIRLHRAAMTGGDSPTAAERGMMLTHLQCAHHALTGEQMPSDCKASPETIREFEGWMREHLGYSNAIARKVAERGFKSAFQSPRDEDEQLVAARSEAIREIGASLRGFALPSFGD